MKIVISAGGRFHAFQLAHQLHKRESLLKFFTFSSTKNDAITIPTTLINNINSCAWIDYLYQKLRVNRIINATNFNSIKDNLFDTLVSHHIKKLPPFDLFVGWAHYALKSIPIVRKKGAKIIIESGSSHIKEQQEILQKEYSRLLIPYTPINTNVIEKMTQEYEQADYIMTLSTNSRQSFIKQGIPSQKILQVTCGTDVEFFMQPSIIKNKPQKFRVIFVGLLNIRKGIHYLIEAWNMLNLPEETTELLLVGCLQKDFKHYLKGKELRRNIIFYGSTNRTVLKQLYAQSSVFVLPSLEDGFGMVMGEAMASGLPIIATTNTGGPDLIKDGVHGYLIPPANSQLLAEKLIWCYEHQELCKAMGQEGKNHIQNFTWDNYGKKVYAIYQEILK